MALGQNVTLTPEQRIANMEAQAGLGEQQTLAVDGAITIKNGKAMMSKGSAGAHTLAAPANPADDGKILIMMPSTAFAHVVTVTGMVGGTTLTFGATTGDIAILRAWKGQWYVVLTKNCTVA